jgi:hypothetical protein
MISLAESVSLSSRRGSLFDVCSSEPDVESYDVKRKREKVMVAYEEFVLRYNEEAVRREETEATAWPLTPRIVRGFLLTIGKETPRQRNKWGWKAVRDWGWPSLVRAQRTKYPEIPIPVEVQVAAGVAIKEVQLRLERATEVPLPSRGKEPCFLVDVVRLVDVVPDYYPDKAREASLWLFGLFTGTRGVSTAHVVLRDLLGVRFNEKEKDFSVVVALRYVKKKTMGESRHQVLVTDFLKDRRSDNPVYWLAVHL